MKAEMSFSIHDLANELEISYESCQSGLTQGDGLLQNYCRFC
jgi:hypothetical protein